MRYILKSKIEKSKPVAFSKLIIRKARRYISLKSTSIKQPTLYNNITSSSFYRANIREEYLMWEKKWNELHHDHKYRNEIITINGIEWNEKNWWIKLHKAEASKTKLLKNVFDSNNQIIKRGRINGNRWHKHKYVLEYKYSDNRKISYVLQERSHIYTEKFSVKNKFEPNTNPVTISVVNKDCLKKAKEWVDEGIETCVLNLANRQHPGGGVDRGACAQEEDLFRRSSYYLAMFPYSYECANDSGVALVKNLYPLDKNYGGVYTSDVTVFRDDAESGYAFLQQPFNVNFIAVAAMNNPTRINGRIADKHVDEVQNKIRTIFRIAVDNNQRNLILGALGCGAFHNPPDHIAELFKDVLCEEEFLGAFERICFAIISDSNSNGDRNYTAFKTQLDGFVLPTVSR